MLIHTSSELAQLHHKSHNSINNPISTCGFCPDVAKLQNRELPERSRCATTEHTPEAGDGRRLDKEVPEAVLSEARRVHRLQLFVGGFNEDTRSRSFLRPALLQEDQELQSHSQSGEGRNHSI